MRGHVRPGVRAAAERAVNWLAGMQNRDGGWAAFDRDINREILTKVPFADHNAMLDPSCPDITARVLEALGEHGWRADRPAVLRALEAAARDRGAQRVVLETGILQPDAIRFYEREGYASIPLYGPYIGCAESRCFARAL